MVISEITKLREFEEETIISWKILKAHTLASHILGISHTLIVKLSINKKVVQ